MATDPFEYLEDDSSGYDLVVCAPPIGLYSPNDRGAFSSGTDALVLAASARLAPGGQGLFVLADDTLRAKRRNLIAALRDADTHLQAVVSLPSLGRTGVPLSVFVFGRRSTERLFVARLPLEGKYDALVQNLRIAKGGRLPELGALVAHKEFAGWVKFELDTEIERLARRMGDSRVSLSEVLERVELGNRSEDGGFVPNTEAVYLPLIGTSAATTRVEELTIKPQNVAQLIVRADRVLPAYFAEFWNSPVGRMVRDRLLSGAFIPKITKASLMEGYVVLPSLEVQEDVVSAFQALRTQEVRVRELRHELWKRPAGAPEIRRRLEAMAAGEGRDAWIERLPFPLASILRRYRAECDSTNQKQHLLHFFEACAEFVAVIMLSAFQTDEELFEETLSGLRSHEQQRGGGWRRGDFGGWVALCEALGKATRRLLSDRETKERCLELYRTRNADAVNAISDRRLFAALKRVNQYRNDWLGHGGAESEQDRITRVKRLEDSLNDVREVIDDSVLDVVRLVRPRQNEFREGVFEYTVELITGSNPIFRKADAETISPMDANRLHLLDPQSRESLPLVPLIRMAQGPATDESACYFYNRLEGADVRWVSYHYETRSEFTEPDAAVAKLIELISG